MLTGVFKVRNQATKNIYNAFQVSPKSLDNGATGQYMFSMY